MILLIFYEAKCPFFYEILFKGEINQINAMKKLITSFNLCKIVPIALFFLSFALESTGQFTLSGEIRPRTEYRHGFKNLATPDMDAALFTDQRTRLNALYATSGYKVKITLQDIRVWGSQPQLNRTDGLTSIHEAWAEAIFNKNLSFRFGRQEISYDDQRIFGAVGWAQQARSHDAGVFIFDNADFKAHLGLAYNQDRPALGGNIARMGGYKSFQYLWLHKEMGVVNASFLFLNNGRQIVNLSIDTTGGDSIVTELPSVGFSQTAGLRFELKKDKITAHFGGYFQMGKVGDTVDTDVSAYNAFADISYKFSDNFMAAVGFEMLSGNSETSPDASNQAFSPFYGTNHKFNGHMDYFYVGNHFGSVGLNDFFVKLKYTKGNAYIGGDVHIFMANNDVMDDTEFDKSGTVVAADANLGTEIDLYGGFNLSDGVACKAGYSQMLASESMMNIKAGDIDETSNWGWVMIIVKPTFISK